MRSTILALLTWLAVLPFCGVEPKAEAMTKLTEPGLGECNLYSFHVLWPDTASSWWFEGEQISGQTNPARTITAHSNLDQGQSWCDGQFRTLTGTTAGIWSIKVRLRGHNMANPAVNVVDITIDCVCNNDGTWYAPFAVGNWYAGSIYTVELVEAKYKLLVNSGWINCVTTWESFTIKTTGAPWVRNPGGGD